MQPCGHPDPLIRGEGGERSSRPLVKGGAGVRHCESCSLSFICYFLTLSMLDTSLRQTMVSVLACILDSELNV